MRQLIGVTWSWNSMKPHGSATFTFIDTSRDIWNEISATCSEQNNVSTVSELYENIFLLQQGDKSLGENYRAYLVLLPNH